MAKPQKADFCIEIQFEKGSKDPARVFRTMQGMIEAFQEIDRSLVKTIDSNIEPVLILEDIESGSIRSWLRSALEAVDDDAIKNLDWKPAVGKYLVKAKYIIVDFLKGKTTITSQDDLNALEAAILEVAKQTDVKWLPVYEKVSRKGLLGNLERISSSLSHLHEDDNASYVVADGETIEFNLEFHLAPESIDELLTKDQLSSESEMILKIKKPDYLGESMWDFRHGGRSFPAKIRHKEWLESFQNREVDIRPGDSIRAIVEITHRYDHDGELLGTDFSIIEILEVIQVSNPQQIGMFDI